MHMKLHRMSEFVHVRVPPAITGPWKMDHRAVFIDKDGTLVENVPYNVDPGHLRFTSHALEALQSLERAGYALVVVTNQPGLALGRFTRAQLVALQQALVSKLRDEGGIHLTAFQVCPHAPSGPGSWTCLCRKPAPGLLYQAARRHGLDLARSWMIGDILDDVEAGRRAGARTVLLDVGNETEWHLTPLRTPHHRCMDLGEAASFLLQQEHAEQDFSDAGVATL